MVDDGSTDATGIIAEKAGAKVLTHIINRGLGGALKTIFAQDLVPRAKDVLEIIAAQQHQPINIEVAVANINLQDYDKLLNNAEDLA